MVTGFIDARNVARDSTRELYSETMERWRGGDFHPIKKRGIRSRHLSCASTRFVLDDE